MKADLIIYNAAQLVTCASEGKPKNGAAAMRDVGIIKNGAAAIVDGKIIGVAESEEILRNFTADETIDAENLVVCPGFVECHTHIVYAGNRLDEFELKIKGADYLEILESGGGILSTVKQTRQASLEELIEESRPRLDKMLKLGVTVCEVKTGYGLTTVDELKMLQAILELDKTHPVGLIPTFLAAHAVPPEFRGHSDEYVDLICEEMLPQAAAVFGLYKNSLNENKVEIDRTSSSRIFDLEKKSQESWNSLTPDTPIFADVFCEKNAFDLEQSCRVLTAAKTLGFRLKAHVDEFTNLGGARMAIELGAASIDHLDAISDDEIKLLAASETVGVVTPTVNFNFGSAEFADARKLIDEGCAVAVSTDYNPGSAPCPSLPNAMAIACRYQKLLPAEAFNAITVNAAYAVGLGNKFGSIEIGKEADLLILNTDDYRQTAYEFGGNFVKSVIKKGKIVNLSKT